MSTTVVYSTSIVFKNGNILYAEYTLTTMDSVRRAACCLPRKLKNMCETGCIYREKPFKHLACPMALKTKATCAAPCRPNEVCVCKTEILVLTKKEKNEVFLL